VEKIIVEDDSRKIDLTGIRLLQSFMVYWERL